jgi:hypothetical protein
MFFEGFIDSQRVACTDCLAQWERQGNRMPRIGSRLGNPNWKGKEMTNLKHKLVALVSMAVIVVAVVVLPGCKKSETPPPEEPNKTVPDAG